MQASEALRRFQDSAKVAFLATVEGDQPRVRPVSPVAVEGNTIWVAAFRSSPKMKQLAANPNVEVCYMDAEHRHLRARGTTRVCADAAVKTRLWNAYPLMKGYFATADDPEYALIEITVRQGDVMESMDLAYQHLQV